MDWHSFLSGFGWVMFAYALGILSGPFVFEKLGFIVVDLAADSKHAKELIFDLTKLEEDNSNNES